MCGCLCERTYCKLGTCSGRQVQGHVPVTVPTYNKGPEQWKHCSSGTKVCEPDCPRVHLLPAVANSFSQGEKDGGQYIFLKGRVGPSILMWNGQNRESEVNVKPWWITGMHYHIFSFTESIKKFFPADWRSKVLEGAHIRYVPPVLMSHSAQVETEKTVCIILYMWWICWCPSVNTCPGVMAPPCSTASRQLRAEVRTAAAMRPACHTRLGSRMSLRNLSESSWKHLGWCTGRGEKDTISQQEYREDICFKYNTATGQHRNISDDVQM